MKKTFKRLFAAVSACAVCAVPLTGNFSASAETTSSQKTYVVYNVAQNPNIAYFDFTLNYSNDVTAEQSTSSALCTNGYFRPTLNAVSCTIQNTYVGDAIGATGTLTATKFYAPMTTTSIFSKLTYNATIRDENNVTLSPTDITLKAVLLGDANQDGVVDTSDADAVIKYVSNSSKYPLTPDGIDAADVYNRGDGLSADDALEIQRYLYGQIEHF